ncbi:adenosine deaminase/editase [Schizophyllum commune]
MDTGDLLPADFIARSVFEVYASTGYKPSNPSQFTILAAFYLFRSPALQSSDTPKFKIISLGTGTKCLPTCQLPLHGEALHDSHAEIIARRGAIRWFLEKIQRMSQSDTSCSEWLTITSEGVYKLQDGAHVGMYISTLPCGDASTRFLAAAPQDAGMAALKDSASRPVVDPTAAARGRDNYALTGVLRTKPGRADAPPTMSMSCSDKIAAWSVLGFQGALASLVLPIPMHIAHIVVGDVPEYMRSVVLEDCERALWRRADPSAHRPIIDFTSLDFIHSRAAVSSALGSPCNTSSNESLSWTADTVPPYEIIVNGTRRGVPPKHQLRPKSLPRISQLGLFRLFCSLKPVPYAPLGTIYCEVKRSAHAYQLAKERLMGAGGALQGWQRCGAKWQNFDVDGKISESIE